MQFACGAGLYEGRTTGRRGVPRHRKSCRMAHVWLAGGRGPRRFLPIGHTCVRYLGPTSGAMGVGSFRQMGWHRGAFYTARWVDRLLFPANWPRAERLLSEWQGLGVGDTVPDGAPETRVRVRRRRARGEPAAGVALHAASAAVVVARPRQRGSTGRGRSCCATWETGGRGSSSAADCGPARGGWPRRSGR